MAPTIIETYPLEVVVSVDGPGGAKGIYVVRSPLGEWQGSPTTLRGLLDEACNRIIASITGDAAAGGSITDEAITRAAIVHLASIAEKRRTEPV
jgi:hypothetical protein